MPAFRAVAIPTLLPARCTRQQYFLSLMSSTGTVARLPEAGSGLMNMRQRGTMAFPSWVLDPYSICFVAIATAAL